MRYNLEYTRLKLDGYISKKLTSQTLNIEGPPATTSAANNDGLSNRSKWWTRATCVDLGQ